MKRYLIVAVLLTAFALPVLAMDAPAPPKEKPPDQIIIITAFPGPKPPADTLIITQHPGKPTAIGPAERREPEKPKRAIWEKLIDWLF